MAGSEKKGIGLLTPAPSQSPFTSGPDSHRRERAASSRKDKGKQKAHAGDVVEYTSDNEAAGSHSTPVSGRPTKRRRVDRPEDDTTNTNGAIQAPTWLESLLGPQERSQPDDDAHADAELDASFHLLDIADITALPNVPVDPAIHRESAELPANETLYVPPAVGRILESASGSPPPKPPCPPLTITPTAMHRALATERRARQRAEALYTFEHTRRQKLEDIAVTLRQKNAVLEVEARAWAARIALSASDPSAFAALRLTVDGEEPAALDADGQPVDVWSLPQIHPPPAGTPSPSFTLVVARQADPGTRRTQGVSADTTGECSSSGGLGSAFPAFPALVASSC